MERKNMYDEDHLEPGSEFKLQFSSLSSISL